MKKLFTIMTLVFATFLSTHTSELHNKWTITKEENDFFCQHLQILLQYCNPLVENGSLSGKNPVYSTLATYGKELSNSNNLMTLIASQKLEPFLSKYIDNEDFIDTTVNKCLEEQVKTKKSDWKKAQEALKVNRFVGAGIVLKSHYPAFAIAPVGTGEARGIAFMQENADFKPDENFAKNYFASFIYKFIYAKRMPQ